MNEFLLIRCKQKSCVVFLESFLKESAFILVLIVVKTLLLEIHGDLVVETLPSQCRRPRFNPWSGKKISHATTNSIAATKIDDPMCYN